MANISKVYGTSALASTKDFLQDISEATGNRTVFADISSLEEHFEDEGYPTDQTELDEIIKTAKELDAVYIFLY